jgi:hypothetical protein
MRHPVGRTRLIPLLTLAVAALWATPGGARAQEQGILGNVTAGDTGRPLEGAMVLLMNAAGTRVNGVLSAANGWFRLPVPAPGKYRLRIQRIGYADTDSDLFDVAAGATVEKRVTASIKPVQLASIDVSGGRRCQVRPADGVATATVWDEARKALAAATWTTDREMYQFSWMKYSRDLDASGRRVLKEQRSFDRHFTSQTFVALDPNELAAHGFVQLVGGGSIETKPGAEWQYYAPDATVMLSDPFLDTHCFRLERKEVDGVRLIGLAFEPIAGRSLPDVAGTIWLEQANARLRSLEFRYVNLLRGLAEQDGRGEINFMELPNGTWIVKDWFIRMPRLAEERDNAGRTRRFVVKGYQDDGGIVQQARTAKGTKIFDDVIGGVHGFVLDSVGRPASGLTVSLEGTQFSTVSDSLGAFSFSDVGRGLYRVVATTPALAEAGETGAHADVQVGTKGIVEVKLELPSLTHAILERCVETPPRSDEAVVVGRVVDRSGKPVSGADVRVSWEEVRDGASGLRMASEGIGQESDDEGLFTFCGVPTDRTVEVVAAVGEQKSEVARIPLGVGTETAVARVVLP